MDYPELRGTKPPTKEYAWREPWFQKHIHRGLSYLASIGGEALGPGEVSEDARAVSQEWVGGRAPS